MGLVASSGVTHARARRIATTALVILGCALAFFAAIAMWLRALVLGPRPIVVGGIVGVLLIWESLLLASTRARVPPATPAA